MKKKEYRKIKKRIGRLERRLGIVSAYLASLDMEKAEARLRPGEAYDQQEHFRAIFEFGRGLVKELEKAIKDPGVENVSADKKSQLEKDSEIVGRWMEEEKQPSELEQEVFEEIKKRLSEAGVKDLEEAIRKTSPTNPISDRALEKLAEEGFKLEDGQIRRNLSVEVAP